MSSVRAIPTSQAYWELRAEQVLNRVFNPETPIDVEICETPAEAKNRPDQPPSPHAATRQAGHQRPAPGRTRRAHPGSGHGSGPQAPLQNHATLLIGGAGLLVCTTAGITLLSISLWQQSQQAIRQERNLLLVERLRAMGPVASAASAEAERSEAKPAAPTLPNDLSAGSDPNPLPPPPSEPWMEQLATLPASSAPAASVLRVPMHQRVGSPAPPASNRPPGPGPTGQAPADRQMQPAKDLPQLVGVVQVPGRPGSAIFQVNGSSTNTAAGETIGGTGWRLKSANGDTVVIERDGVQRRISISSGS